MKSSLLSAAKSLATGNRFRARASLAIASAVIAAGTALTPSVSQAVIIWSGELDLLTGNSTIDLNGNLATDPNESEIRMFVGVNLQFEVKIDPNTNFRTVANPVAANTVIDANSPFSNLGYSRSPQPFDQRRIVAFESGSENGPRYGWVEYSTVSGQNVPSIILHQWAFNSTPNEQILAGAIPEPAHAALFTAATALVAVGLIRRRKRQQA
jgi:hypothetical protein